MFPAFPNTIKKIIIHLKFQMGGAIIRRKNNNSVVSQSSLLNQINYSPNISVHTGNHSRIGRTGSKMRSIAIALGSGKGRIIPL